MWILQNMTVSKLGMRDGKFVHGTLFTSVEKANEELIRRTQLEINDAEEELNTLQEELKMQKRDLARIQHAKIR